MKRTAEVKEKVFKERKTYFTRDELCDAFLNREKYGECKCRFPHYFIYDYLIQGAIFNKVIDAPKEEAINGYICYRSNSMKAIINRKNKEIVINSSFQDFNVLANKAKAAGYDVYVVMKITCYDLLSNPRKYKELLTLNMKYLINEFCQGLAPVYYSIYENTKRCINNSRLNDQLINSPIYKEIGMFINKYLVDKYFNLRYIHVFTSLCVTTYAGCNTKSVVIIPPTMDQIENNKVFSIYDYNILNIKHFYNTYCNGWGIAYNEMLIRFDKTPTYYEIYKYKKLFDINFEVPEEYKCYYSMSRWSTMIEGLHARFKKAKEYKEKQYEEKSKDNRTKACAEYDELANNYLEDVKYWRTHNTGSHLYIEYKKYFKDKSDRNLGTFKVTQEYVNHRFKTPQFMLKDNYVMSNHRLFCNINLFESNIQKAIDAIDIISLSGITANEKIVVTYEFKYAGATYTSKKKWLDIDNNYSDIPCNKQVLIHIEDYNFWLDDLYNFYTNYCIGASNKFINIVKIVESHNKLKKW